MLRLYRDWRMAKIFFLGFISGFPWLLIASMVALWLKEEGLSRSGIGLFGLVFGVYAINALWAPVIDGIKIPFLSKMFGQRRAWIILMQIVIAVCMLCIFLLPSVNGYLGIFENFPPLLNLLTQYGDSWWAKSILILDSRLFYLALLVFIIATASATQDVAIDATRIEMIKTEEPEKISAGSAMATSGWWLGFGGGKALALPFVQLLQEAGIVNAWQSGYLALTVIVILCIMGVIFFIRVPAVPHPRRRHKNPWRCERSSCMPIPSCLLSAAIPCRWRYCCYFLSSFSKSARRFWDVCRWCFTKKSGSPKRKLVYSPAVWALSRYAFFPF